MRKFNKDERNYIRLINSTDRDGRGIADIFDNDLIGAILRINKVDRTADFIFEIANQELNDKQAEDILNRIFELQYKIVLLTNLIQYLEENGLLTSYVPQPSLENVISFGQGDAHSLAATRSINDSKIIDLLIKYVDKKLLPSVELRELERHNFKSVEERRFFWEQLAVWAGILIAVALGLWGIFDSSNEKYQKELRQEVRILNDSLSNKLSQLGKEISKKDSLNVNISHTRLKHCKK